MTEFEKYTDLLDAHSKLMEKHSEIATEYNTLAEESMAQRIDSRRCDRIVERRDELISSHEKLALKSYDIIRKCDRLLEEIQKYDDSFKVVSLEKYIRLMHEHNIINNENTSMRDDSDIFFRNLIRKTSLTKTTLCLGFALLSTLMYLTN